MPDIKLSFCEVNFLRENIVEVIPFEGVEVGKKSDNPLNSKFAFYAYELIKTYR